MVLVRVGVIHSGIAQAMETTIDTVLVRRLSAQMLSGKRPRDPVSVVERLLAIQAQDLRGARMAIRARTQAVTVADLDRALTDDRSLVITWVNRGTLHLIRTEDYAWLHPLTTPPLFAGNARRLAQEGVSARAADRGVQIITRALAHGPLTRAQLRDRLAARDIPVKGQALVHILMLASLRGHIARGPMMIGREQAYVLVRDWIGTPRAFDREQALAMLARRYLAGHGPASDRDLAGWAGLPLRDARAGLKALELIDVGDGLADLPGRRPAALPPPRLLGPYEPVLLGWMSRALILGSHEQRVIGNGLFRPIALVNGRGVATWMMQGDTLVLMPFSRIPRENVTKLESDARALERFFR